MLTEAKNTNLTSPSDIEIVEKVFESVFQSVVNVVSLRSLKNKNLRIFVFEMSTDNLSAVLYGIDDLRLEQTIPTDRKRESLRYVAANSFILSANVDEKISV